MPAENKRVRIPQSLPALVCLLVACSLAQTAGAPVAIPVKEAGQHILSETNPVYPALAKAAHIQGDVKLEARVNEKGDVTEIRVISGHPMLVQAAMDASRQWKYRPFTVNGKAVTASVPLVVQFRLGISDEQLKKESAAVDAYFAQEPKCRDALKAQSLAQAEAPCQALAALAEKLPDGRYMERTTGIRLAGHAFFYQRKFQEALPYYKEELETAKKHLTETDAELAYAYRDVAHALHGLGALPEARSDYETALAILEKARANIDSAFLKNEYSKTIQSTLREYAVLLGQEGDPAGAAASEEKARSMVIQQGLKDK